MKKIKVTKISGRIDNVAAEVLTVIMEKTGIYDVERLTPDLRFTEDLGLSDLDFVELIMAFEERLGIEIPDEEAGRFRTIGDAVRYLEDNVPG